MGAASQGLPAVLGPGQSNSITFVTGLTTTTTPVTFELSTETADSTDQIDFATLGAEIRPSGLTDSQWNAMLQVLEQESGPTWGGFVDLMAEYTSNVCEQCGGSIYSAQDVLQAVLTNAYFQTEGGVTGTVSLGDPSHPLAGAVVTLATADGSQADSAASQSDGTFVLPQMPPGTYSLSVSGYLLAQPVQVTVPSSGDVSGLAVVVTQGGVISGTVAQFGSGDPLSGVSVIAASSAGISYGTQSGADGNYQLTGLPDGTYAVTAGGGAFDTDTSGSESILDSDDVGGVNFALAPAATLQGQVTSAADGTPVDEATVLLVNNTGVSFSASTDTSGAYTITNLAAGTYTLTVEANNFAVATLTGVVMQSGVTTTLPAVAMTAAGSVAITLEDPTSAPIPAVGVDLIQNGAVVAVGETDSSGTATLSGLAAGTYQVQTEAPPFLTADATVTIAPGVNPSETYQLQPGCSIQGTVTDGSGSPLANVPVTVLNQDGSILATTTASDGTYEVQGLDAGSFAVSVGNAPGLERQIITLSTADPDATVNFTLAGAVVSGSVVQADGTTPVTNALVCLVSSGSVLVAGETDANGDYAFEDVVPGTYTVLTGGRTGIAASASFTVGSQDANLPAIVLSTLQVSGTVAGPSGQPLAGATVLVVPQAEPLAALGMTAVTDSNGQFSVSGATPGSYEVQVQDDGFAPQSQVIALSAQGAPLAIQLQTGTTLSGQITDATGGGPVAGVQVTVFSATTHNTVASGQTDSSGAYQLTGLAPGTYNLVASNSTQSVAEVLGIVVAASPITQRRGPSGGDHVCGRDCHRQPGGTACGYPGDRDRRRR